MSTILNQEWFDRAFENSSPVPPQLRTMAERMCRAFNICGTSDPMYIANVVALELGAGDGCSHFYDKVVRAESSAIEKLAQRFSFSYSTCIAGKALALRQLLADELGAAKLISISPVGPSEIMRESSAMSPLINDLENTYLDAAAELRTKQAGLENHADELHRFIEIRDQLQAHPDFSGYLPETYYSGGDLDPVGVKPLHGERDSSPSFGM